MNIFQRISTSQSAKLRKPARAFAGYLMQRLGVSERFELARAGYALPFYCRSDIALTLFSDPTYCDAAEAFVTGYVLPGDTVIDVGANIGCITAAAALAAGEDGRVYSIEAHPVTFAYLERTVARNRLVNVVCLNFAAAGKSGIVHMSDEKRKDDTNRVIWDLDAGMVVNSSTIGMLIAAQGITRVDLLKIDVEGFEAQVLAGLEGYFDRVECIHIEALEHLLKRYMSSCAEVVALLKRKGFRCFSVRGDTMNIVALQTIARASRFAHELTEI